MEALMSSRSRNYRKGDIERELGLDEYKFPRSEKSGDFIEAAKTAGLVILGTGVFLFSINELGQKIFPAIPDLSRIWEYFWTKRPVAKRDRPPVFYAFSIRSE